MKKSLNKEFHTIQHRVVETEEEAQGLQKDIDAMVAWADGWKMDFNVDKCKVMHLGKRNRKFTYKMKETTLKETSEVK